MNAAGQLAQPRTRPRSRPLSSAARAYFASDARRIAQTALGLIWLLDGALQFQSFMYSKAASRTCCSA